MNYSNQNLKMCEFCTKHKRKKWFLDPENYEEKMLEDKGRKNVLQKLVGYNLEYYIRDGFENVRWTEYPIIGGLAKKAINKLAKAEHGGQVITLEDAFEMVDLSDKHVAFECYCRKLSGLSEKFCCINFGPMRDICKLANPHEKMEEIDASEAKLRLKDYDKQGLFHQVLWAKPPFPIAVCNCDVKYCIPMKFRTVFDIQGVLSGHEIAVVDHRKCRCEEYSCISFCQFGAIYVDRENNKIIIDPTKCMGCSLCANACKYNAITMEPIEKVMGKKIKW